MTAVALLLKNLASAVDSIFFVQLSEGWPQKEQENESVILTACTASVCVLSSLKKRIVLIGCGQSN